MVRESPEPVLEEDVISQAVTSLDISREEAIEIFDSLYQNGKFIRPRPGIIDVI